MKSHLLIVASDLSMYVLCEKTIRPTSNLSWMKMFAKDFASQVVKKNRRDQMGNTTIAVDFWSFQHCKKALVTAFS